MQNFNMPLADEAATIRLGVAFAKVLKPGLCLYLEGELGAGKTTLVRAMLKAVGHSGSVKSPTYTLVEPYTVDLQQTRVEIFHFDLYRLVSPEEFLDAGFRDMFTSETICIVEWPQHGQPVLPRPDLHLFLAIADTQREIQLCALSTAGVQCLTQLQTYL